MCSGNSIGQHPFKWHTYSWLLICCVQFISKSFLHKSSYLHNNSKHKALHHWNIMFTSLTHCSDVFGNMDLVEPPCHYPTDLQTIRSNLWSITAMTCWSWRCHVVIMTSWHDNMTVWDPPLDWQHPVTKSQWAWAGPGLILHTAHWVNTGLRWAEWSGSNKSIRSLGQIKQSSKLKHNMTNKYPAADWVVPELDTPCECELLWSALETPCTLHWAPLVR